MNLNFLKLKKDNTPSLKSLKPRMLSVNLFWFANLGLFLVMSGIVVAVGVKLFCFQYFESYKEFATESFEKIINVDRLTNMVERRNDFINKKISLPRDPSL